MPGRNFLRIEANSVFYTKFGTRFMRMLEVSYYRVVENPQMRYEFLS